MFSTGGTIPADERTSWRDVFKNVDIPAEHRRNNYGFRMDEDLDYGKEYVKSPGERLVLITGGSAVHGVGATKNETNVAARMEQFLNEKQNRWHYKVLNFGMGSAIAYQQFLALTLWGKWMDPDWIVVMDGHNDIAVCSAHSQGAGFPMYYHHMQSYIDGYLQGQVRPAFYRGWLENQIIKYSFAYRTITGKQYVPCNQQYTYDEGFPRVATDVRWEDIEGQVTFYSRAQELMVNLSDQAKYLLSLQPIVPSFSDIFGKSEEELAGIASENQDKNCGGIGPFYQFALSYFLCRADTELNDITKRYKDKANVQYYNMNAFLPDSSDDRKRFFIDNMHLNDAGHELMGKLYAARILMADFPELAPQLSKDWEKTLLEVKDVPAHQDNSPGIHVMEATYGWNCRDMKPPIGKNTVRRGNATKVVSRACDGKMRWEFGIDCADIGDPANSCAKDFSVKWRCGADPKVYETYVEGEANGKIVMLSCP